jgi:hypothetical protein
LQLRRKVLPALALVPVLALAACGGGGNGTTTAATSTAAATPAPPKVRPAGPSTSLGKAAYVTRMQQLGNRLDGALDTLYPISYRPGGTAAARDTLAKLLSARGTVEGIEADLEAIAPPAPVAADQRRLVAALRQIDGELGLLLAGLRTSDPDAFTKYASLPALQQIQKATLAMENHGYDVIRKAR